MNSSLSESTYTRSIIILGCLFFIFGFVTWMNGVLIPYLKIACELNNFESYLVAFAFYISYFVTALPSSRLLKIIGFKKGMMAGLFTMAFGALMFVPAALTRTYSLFLAGLFIIGTGLSILQTASNPYITILGPLESAAKRISIMGICNKIAGTLAPLILGAIVLHNADALMHDLSMAETAQKSIILNELASRVIVPYVIMAFVLAGLAIMVYASGLPEIDMNADVEDLHKDETSAIPKSIWKFPNLTLGVIAIFLYVGTEVIAGDSIGNYGQHQGIALSVAKTFTSFTLTAMVIGYIAGIILIPKYISQQAALKYSAITGIAFSIIILFSSGYVSVMFLALLGLANALVWPAVWPLALRGLGKFTETGSALLIMAIAGGALLPLLYGSLADTAGIGPQYAYFILIPCYLFILFYSVKGYKLR